jgi:hypothetical protein
LCWDELLLLGVAFLPFHSSLLVNFVVGASVRGLVDQVEVEDMIQEGVSVRGSRIAGSGRGEGSIGRVWVRGSRVLAEVDISACARFFVARNAHFLAGILRSRSCQYRPLLLSTSLSTLPSIRDTTCRFSALTIVDPMVGMMDYLCSPLISKKIWQNYIIRRYESNNFDSTTHWMIHFI